MKNVMYPVILKYRSGYDKNTCDYYFKILQLS